MSYVEDTLIKDEEIICIGVTSVWALSLLIFLGFLSIVLTIILGYLFPFAYILFFVSGLLCWLWAFIIYKTTELALTNKRVVAKFGFIARSTMEIKIDKVESIRVEQTVLGRIFDFGTLVISGTGTSHSPIPNIADPMAFRKKVMEFQISAESSTKV